MALGLALFYRGGALALVLPGLLIFGLLALLRPGLGLLFVPLTAPLYLIPAAIQGIRGDSFRLPIHEVALLVTAGATAAGWLVRRVVRDERPRTNGERPTLAEAARIYMPHVLLLVAGVLGVLLAVERGPALREFRWLIAEPLIFYALVRTQGADWPSALGPQPSALVTAFVLGGAVVGLLGLLQYIGLDLAPLLGDKQCFAPDGQVCSNIVTDGGVRRVLSVYGHPNNLGLYLGRVWPLAAAYAITLFRTENRELRTKLAYMPGSWFLVLGSVLCLGGIVVSFSRGAWLGAVVALAILALPALRRRFRGRLAPALLGLGAGLAVLAGLALSLRGDVTAGSTPIRLLLWREALAYIRLHPLGIGLDQFIYYHDPRYGRSLIDPSLLNTSEVYAAHPHNLLLDIWLRMGPLGLVAFGWLLARFLRDAWRGITTSDRAPLALGALAAMAAALVHGLVDNFYFVPDLAITFWLLLALTENREPRTENREP
jgi:putative inorganic carbon (HCO3(-)) transporter